MLDLLELLTVLGRLDQPIDCICESEVLMFKMKLWKDDTVDDLLLVSVLRHSATCSIPGAVSNERNGSADVRLQAVEKFEILKTSRTNI